MSRWQIAFFLIAAAALAALAVIAVPRAIDIAGLLSGDPDPADLADRRIARMLNPDVATREIESALAAKDADLAQSFLDLAAEHHIAISPALAAQVKAATEEANSATHSAENFAKGLISGEPEDLAGMAGTAVGDLFVFGDVRDAVREGSRLVAGEHADRLVLGLACIGLAVTVGTYATLGSAAPVRVGLTVAKAARKTGRLGVRMAQWLGRSLRDVVDWSKFRKAISGASLAQPTIAIRAARDAVKLDKAGGIIDLVRDVGRVETKAGTQTALDALKLADKPEDMARIARIAAKKGSKTRAILKMLGGAALLTASASVGLMSWVLWAVLALFGFVSSTKAAVERFTLRHLRRRKQELRDQRLAAIALNG